jgi:hypothetical protein
MSVYGADHAGALADVRAAGAAVTVAAVTPGTHDPATGLFTSPTTTTVTGVAIRTRGIPERYAALGLVESESPSLLFVPDTFGAIPPLNGTLTWGGVGYTVRDVEPLAPDGTAILSRLVVAR